MATEAQWLAGFLAAFFFAALVAKGDAWHGWKSSVHEWAPARVNPVLLIFGIPAAEAVAVILLIATPPVGFVAAAVLLFVLGVGVLVLLPTRRDIGCGCFGSVVPSRLTAGLAVRNLLMATGCGALALVAAEVPGTLSAPQVLIPTLTLASVALLFEGRAVLALVRTRGVPDD